ncbi:MAG: OmpA family protein [Bacteroidetes bacterium]|nr:OmpA family protein [Bacteroidota bacterium]MBU1720778.1 OmpA family protein [Bacteroidota bacterium]
MKTKIYPRLLLVAFLCLTTGTAFADGIDPENKSRSSSDSNNVSSSQYEDLLPWELKFHARDLLRQGYVEEAAKVYTIYFQKKKTAKVAWEAAMLFMELRYYTEAGKWFSEVIALDANKYPLAYLYEGQMLKAQEKYAEAQASFTQLRSKSSSISYKNRKVLNTELSSLKAILKAQVDSTTIVSATQNTADFTGNSGMPAEVAGKTKGLEIGTWCYSSDKSRIYFSSISYNWKFQETSTLWIADNKDGQWQTPVKLSEPINKKNFASLMPTTAIDKKTGKEVLYFVSNRASGKGGYDIWYVEYDAAKNRFSKPRNAGKINTAGNEVSPWLDNTAVLYFSSDGHPGYGNLDIFKVKGEKNHWRTPENLGSPINSGADDLYFIGSSDGQAGIFESNRDPETLEPGCCNSTFAFTKIYQTGLAQADKQSESTLNAEEALLAGETFRLSNVYYEFNKADLTESARQVIDSTLFAVLIKYPDIVVEVSSHTDNIGNDAYNEALSQERATNVANYLISKGIDPSRLLASGYGETMPIAENTTASLEDNPEGRALNRRTEFRVIGNQALTAYTTY